MDDEKKTNGWDSLIENLGVQPDESAFERHQPAPKEIPPSVERRDAEQASTGKKPSSSDWNSLAESLGLEVSEPTPDEPAPKETAAVASEKSHREPPSETISSEEFAFEAESPDEFPETDTTAETDFQPEESEDLPPLLSPMDQALSEAAWEDNEKDTGEKDTKAKAEHPSDEDLDSQGARISGEAARSAFDALFSEGATGWGSAFLPTPKRDDPGRVEKRPLVDDVPDESFIDSAEAKTDKDDEDTDRPKRKRSRRRRRGGKGRQPKGERAAEAGEAHEESADTDSTQKRSRSRPRPVEVAGDEDDDDDLDLSLDGDYTGDDAGEDDSPDDLGSPRGGARQRHRNIPTWSDAIGMIVDANLEQRTKSPSKPQSSRSRGRGGRRRGGKQPESK